MHKDSPQPRPHILPRLDIPKDQLPVVEFRVQPELLRQAAKVDKAGPGILTVPQLQDVGTRLFDLPFHLLPDTLSSIAGRKVSTAEISEVRGSVLITRSDSYILQYNATLHSGERIPFRTEVLRTPMSEGEHIREKFIAMNRLSILFNERLSDEAKSKFRILTPLQRGTIDNAGEWYSFQTYESVDPKKVMPLMLDDQPISGLNIYRFVQGATKPNGVLELETVNLKPLQKLINRAERIIKSSGPGRFPKDSTKMWDTLNQSPEWEGYSTLFNTIYKEIIQLHTLCYAVTDGRVSSFSLNGADLLAYIRHGEEHRFVLSRVDSISEPMTTEEWKKGMKQIVEMGMKGKEFALFGGIFDETFDEALEWANSQIVGETPKYFWDNFNK